MRREKNAQPTDERGRSNNGGERYALLTHRGVLRGEDAKSVLHNLGVFYEKYPFSKKNKEGSYADFKRKNERKPFSLDKRGEAWEHFLRTVFSLNMGGATISPFSTKIASDFIREYNTYTHLLYDSLRDFAQQQKHTLILRDFKTASPLAIYTGASSLYEVGFIFHKPLGVPYVPGSALKGLLRSTALLLIAGGDVQRVEALDMSLRKGELEEDVTIPESDDNPSFSLLDIGVLFGMKNWRGVTIFGDILPVIQNENEIKRLLTISVVNPHFRTYYQSGGTTPPLDTDPIPLHFLALSKDVKLRVPLLIETTRLKGKIPGEETVYPYEITPRKAERIIAFLLTEAFSHLGIGAKTTSGFGRLAEVE